MRVRARVKFRARVALGLDGEAGRRVAMVVERDEGLLAQGVAGDLVRGRARAFGFGVWGCWG